MRRLLAAVVLVLTLAACTQVSGDPDPDITSCTPAQAQSLARQVVAADRGAAYAKLRDLIDQYGWQGARESFMASMDSTTMNDECSARVWSALVLELNLEGQ